MASSGARLLTWLLATVALWALLALIAAWSGLGGRYTLSPDDPTQVEAVPAVKLAISGSRLPDMDHYAAISRHPLFYPDREPFVGESTGDGNLVVDEPVAVPLDATLTGVIKIGNDTAIAFIRPAKGGETETVTVGNTLSGDLSIYKLVQLDARKAVFEGPSGSSELLLETFSGKGGKPATQLNNQPKTGTLESGAADEDSTADDSPENKAETIRRRIEERRRQMREEAERARADKDG